MRRKVILLGPLPPPFGGVSVYMSALYEHLKTYGVRVLALDLGAEKTTDPQVRFVRHRRLGHLPALFREGRRARILDATHFHLEYPNKLLLPLWLGCKLLLGFEWYKNIHDGSLPRRHRQFTLGQRVLFRLAASFVDEFVVVSEELRRWLEEEIKVRQRVTVRPCLLNIPRRTLDAPLSAKTERLLEPYMRRARRVCSIGVFIPDYAFQQAARAVERLRAETGEDVGLLLLDGRFACDEGYRAEVLRGREWVTVLENVPNPEVYRVLKRSDVFVRATLRESYGISRVEAMWCGLPVVATRVGETRGMLLYTFGDEDALLCQLKRALSAPPAQDVERWAEKFRQEAEENLRSLMRTMELA